MASVRCFEQTPVVPAAPQPLPGRDRRRCAATSKAARRPLAREINNAKAPIAARSPSKNGSDKPSAYGAITVALADARAGIRTRVRRPLAQWPDMQKAYAGGSTC